MTGSASSGARDGVARALVLVAIAAAFGASAMTLSAACIDGTTPDCSGADAQCGPDGAVFDVNVPDTLDAKSVPDSGDAALPEASAGDSATDAPSDDAAPDSGDASHD